MIQYDEWHGGGIFFLYCEHGKDILGMGGETYARFAHPAANGT